jgi:hypothetical protein
VTLVQVGIMFKHFNDRAPPVHRLVAGFVGFKPKVSVGQSEGSAEEGFAGFLAAVMGSPMAGQVQMDPKVRDLLMGRGKQNG